MIYCFPLNNTEMGSGDIVLGTCMFVHQDHLTTPDTIETPHLKELRAKEPRPSIMLRANFPSNNLNSIISLLDVTYFPSFYGIV